MLWARFALLLAVTVAVGAAILVGIHLIWPTYIDTTGWTGGVAAIVGLLVGWGVGELASRRGERR